MGFQLSTQVPRGLQTSVRHVMDSSGRSGKKGRRDHCHGQITEQSSSSNGGYRVGLPEPVELSGLKAYSFNLITGLVLVIGYILAIVLTCAIVKWYKNI